MRIAHIGDIHGCLEFFFKACEEDVDIIVSTGDFFPDAHYKFFPYSKNAEIAKHFQEGFFSANKKHIIEAVGERPFIYVSGNHDFADIKDSGFTNAVRMSFIDDPVLVKGYTWWGFGGMPFSGGNWNNEISKQSLEIMLETMPVEFDILVTHAPPKGMLDMSYGGHRLGFSGLLEKTFRIEGLKAHLFGHIHEDSGFERMSETPDSPNLLYSNAGALNHRVFEI